MRKRVGAILFCLSAFCLVARTAWSEPACVLLFIGDGMGTEHVRAAGMYADGAPGGLCFESFPCQAKMTTHMVDLGVTDSAAAATAIATGHKVHNGVISMAMPGDGSEMETLLEYFRNQGKSTGLVTTACITDATPAAFGAHEPSRKNAEQIAADYLNQTVPNVLFGGGGNGMSAGTATDAGYAVVTNRAEMTALDTETATMVSGQFGTGHMPYEYDGLGSFPHLSEMTATAIKILDNDPDGFFLMVEGARIDHASHADDIGRAVPEIVEFAKAVQVAVDWAQRHDDVLILVTADHETGGPTILANNGRGRLPTVSWSGGDHTAANVPVYALGVNASLVGGVMDNTDVSGIAKAPACRSCDANGDGQVSFYDLLSFSTSYGLSSGDAYLHAGFDINGDGKIDFSDLCAFSSCYGASW